MALKAEVFDSRRNVLGEGPTSSGAKNNHVMWVDIYGKAVRWRNLESGEIGEYQTPEDVGFVIPLAEGGELLGTAHGPHVRDLSGNYRKVPGRVEADGYLANKNLRWNDAKVAPWGDLFLGSMTYDFETNAGALYQLQKGGRHIRRLFGDVTISNGIDWTIDQKIMFYVDTPLRRVDKFDVEERDIKNRRTFINFPDEFGMPDGFCMDANDNLWVAFWEGSAIRCFDGQSGKLIEQIDLPARRITSGAFAGANLDQLIITSARDDDEAGEAPEAGMTFIATPGVKGKVTNTFTFAAQSATGANA